MTTFTTQVAADVDDAWHYNGSMIETTSGVYTNYLNVKVLLAGFRFNNVTVNNATLIESSGSPTTFVELQSLATSVDDMDTELFADDVDDSEVIEGGTDLVDRTLTTASVFWTNLDAGTSFIKSPDIATIIQEIVDRGGWSNGNDLTIIAFDPQSSVRYYSTDYTTDPSAAAKITIVHTAGAASVPASPRLKIGVGK